MPRTAGIGAILAFTFGFATVALGQAPAAPQKDSAVTIVGCVVSETDYRQAHNLGKGALRGAGLGDEFVIVDATSTPAAGVPSAGSEQRARPAPAPSASAETCAEKGSGQAYRITGHREEELKAFAGHRLEVTGTLKHEAAGTAASDASAGKLPPEVDMASYREVTSAGPQAAAPPSSAPPANVTTPAPAPNAPAASNQSAPSSSARALPRTASSRPLVALIGLLSLMAASGLWLLPRRVF